MNGEWRKIPEYPNYEVSYFGEIRRVLKNGSKKGVTPYVRTLKNNSKYMCVHLSNEKGRRNVSVAYIVYTCFSGKIPKGFKVVHKNGVFRDNILTNLELRDPKSAGIMTGGSSRRKPVIKCTPEFEPVEAYSSAREAARENFMSSQAILDRCNGKVKSLVAPDGFVYMWDKDEYYEEAA